MDALTLLEADHATVEKLFTRFEGTTPRAAKTRAEVVEKIIKELSIHAAVEESVLYPAVKECSEELKSHTLESLEEHHVVKWLLDELSKMTPADERFEAKVTVLIENVRHHVEEEETEFFPEIRKIFSDEQLAEMGDLVAQAKKTAPTRPHPKAPDEPPGIQLAGLVSGFVDRVRDAAAGR